jgi:hypothetical protein
MQLLQKYQLGWKHIMLPPSPPAPQIIITNIKKLHLIFSCACEHCILDYFCSLKLVYLKEIQTNMYELEHVKYICVEINMSQNMKNCEYISKLKLWILEFCSEFFRGEWYSYTSTKSNNIWKFKSFGQKSIQKICFFAPLEQ